jgi:hypothetical protein
MPLNFQIINGKNNLFYLRNLLSRSGDSSALNALHNLFKASSRLGSSGGNSRLGVEEEQNFLHILLLKATPNPEASGKSRFSITYS